MKNMKALVRWTLLLVLLFPLAPCVRADSLIKKPDHVYIATFNVYRLGCEADKYNALVADSDEINPTAAIPERIQNLARVLAVGAFDLVAFQEVSAGIQGKTAIADLCAELENEHGLTYSYFLSPPIGQGFNMTEVMAFIYNPQVVQPELIPGQASLTEVIPCDGRDLVRTQWEAGDFDFTLVSVHLAWGNEADRDAGYELVEDILESPTPSKYSDDPDIIVLGDFNRFGDSMESVKHLTEDEQLWFAPNVQIFDPSFNEVKEVTKSSIHNKGIPGDDPQLLSTTVAANRRVYDMFLLTKDVDEEFPGTESSATYGVDFGIIHFDEPSGFGFQPGADQFPNQTALKIGYSDHRPLWMAFSTTANSADDGPGGLPLSTPQESATFVATEFGSRFHRETCYTLKGKSITLTWSSRADAMATHIPCKVCEP